jgi:hypothetical protein
MKISICILSALLVVLLFSACPKSGDDAAATVTAAADTSITPDLSITLTKTLVDRYIKTLPAYAKIAKDSGEMYELVSSTILAKPEMVKLLADDGWKDSQEFVNVHGKIWGVSGWIGAYDTMKGQPQAMRDAYTKTTYQQDFVKSNVSEDERKLLWAAQPKLLQAVAKADE